MQSETRSVHLSGLVAPVEMYPCAAQGAWFEKGHHGEVGSLYAPMHLGGSFDPEEVAEIGVSYFDASGEQPPECEHTRYARDLEAARENIADSGGSVHEHAALLVRDHGVSLDEAMEALTPEGWEDVEVYPCPVCGEPMEATVPLWLKLNADGEWSVYGIGDEAAKITCTEGHVSDNPALHEGLTQFVEAAFPGTSWRDTDPRPDAGMLRERITRAFCLVLSTGGIPDGSETADALDTLEEMGFNRYQVLADALRDANAIVGEE